MVASHLSHWQGNSACAGFISLHSLIAGTNPVYLKQLAEKIEVLITVSKVGKKGHFQFSQLKDNEVLVLHSKWKLVKSYGQHILTFYATYCILVRYSTYAKL